MTPIRPSRADRPPLQVRYAGEGVAERALRLGYDWGQSKGTTNDGAAKTS
jgi:hypothetical protein